MRGIKWRAGLVPVAAAWMLVLGGCRTAEPRRAAPEQLARAEVAVLDDFETVIPWRVEADQGDAAEVEPSAPTTDKKGRAMAVTFELGEKKKVVLGRRFARPQNLSTCSAIVMDVESRLDTDCRLSLALLTLPGWTYSESPSATLTAGSNPNVMFRLDRAHFKSAKSRWKHRLRLPGAAAVSKLVLILQPREAGRIEIDNIRYVRFNPTLATDAK